MGHDPRTLKPRRGFALLLAAVALLSLALGIIVACARMAWAGPADVAGRACHGTACWRPAEVAGPASVARPAEVAGPDVMAGLSRGGASECMAGR
eukprot:365522-Chlamydomonas_euryale.AAC.17